MTGKTHQLIGLAVGLTAYLVMMPPEYSPATLGTVLVSSHLMALLPDIDQPAATIWRSIPLGRVLGQVTDPFLQHRNLTHSLLGVVLVGWGLHSLLRLVPSYWGIQTHVVFISAILAYCSHLLADMVTVEGIPLFFPYGRMYGIPPRPFQGVRIMTGKWFENLVIFPLVNLYLFFLIWHYWGSLKLIIFR